MRISDWSSDVCSSDLRDVESFDRSVLDCLIDEILQRLAADQAFAEHRPVGDRRAIQRKRHLLQVEAAVAGRIQRAGDAAGAGADDQVRRSEEHTSELQSLMRISYAVFCLKKKNKNTTTTRKMKIHRKQIHITRLIRYTDII